jgi:adenylate cyclase
MTNTHPKLRIVSAALPAASDPDTEIGAGFSAIIRAELNRVLTSPQFDTSERNRRFLEYVVEETLAGRADRIKAYNVATIVFGRDDSFDPQLDPVVRMEARRLRRALERLYLVDGDVGSVRITLPKGGYVPKFEDPAVQSDAEEPAPDSTRDTASVCRGPSIQVSAFAIEDEQPASAEYGDGFVRQLAVGLSRFPEFDVFTPQPIAGSHPYAAQPGNSPWADLILAGDTSASPDVFRVKVTLVHARSGRVVWGETFAQSIGDKGILEARDRIADRIVRVLAEHGAAILSSSFGGDLKDAGNLASLEGLIHFSRYRRWPRRDLYSMARRRLERAVAIDPNYAETVACLSQIYSDGHRFGFAVMEASELRRRALETALQAVELSPASSRAYYALGVAHWYTGDKEASLAAIETALALNPNAADAMADLGLYKCLLGDWDNGFRLIEESLAGKPVQTGIQRIGLSLHFFHTGQFGRALAEANRIGTPHVTHGFVARAISLVRLGRRSEAQEAVAHILELNPRYGREVLHEFGGNNVHKALAHEIEGALRDAGLVPISVAS